MEAGELRERLDRIEQKLDMILAAGQPFPTCGVCGLPIGPLDGVSPHRSARHYTIGQDLVRRHEHCKNG